MRIKWVNSFKSLRMASGTEQRQNKQVNRDFLKYEYSILNFFYIYYSLKYYYYENESVKVLVAQLCPSVCNSMDCSPPGYCVHGIFQARILKWVAIPFSKGSCQPRDRTWVSCTAGRFFIIWATREAPTIIITTLKKKKKKTFKLQIQLVVQPHNFFSVT